MLPPSGLLLGEAIAQTQKRPDLLIFSAYVEDNWDIYTWQFTAERAPIRRTHTPYDESAPSLAPDHSFCVYETVDGKLWRLSLGEGAAPGEPPVRQGEAPAEPAASSKHTAFAQLPFGSEQHFDMHPAVSADNESIVLATSLDRRTDDTDLIVYDASTRTFGRRLELMSFQHYPAWAPDGRHVAFANLHGRLQTGSPISEIWVMAVHTAWARQLTLLDALCVSPAWSPDGLMVAFASNRGGNFDIWVVDPVSRAYRRVTDHPDADSDPTFSPDGQSILFVSMREGRSGLWRLTRGDGELQPVYPFEQDHSIPCKDPDWK